MSTSLNCCDILALHDIQKANEFEDIYTKLHKSDVWIQKKQIRKKEILYVRQVIYYILTWNQMSEIKYKQICRKPTSETERIKQLFVWHQKWKIIKTDEPVIKHGPLFGEIDKYHEQGYLFQSVDMSTKVLIME